MFSKLVRIGKDATLKFTPSGTAILEINAVYDIGFGDKKESQWIRLAMFGQRAEKLQAHFTKGTQILVHADDIKARAYMTKSGEAGCSLEGKLVEFQFAGGGQQQQAPQQTQYQQPQQPQYDEEMPDW
ncbi:primosome PriB/single-strand DNA-binding protein [Vibrio phage LP.2]|nr:primosome PriB/single-strand DNA-binding protein [Vibrio phage LP.2]